MVILFCCLLDSWWVSWQDWNDDFDDEFINQTYWENKTAASSFGGSSGCGSATLSEISNGDDRMNSYLCLFTIAGEVESVWSGLRTKQNFNDSNDYNITFTLNGSTSAGSATIKLWISNDDLSTVPTFSTGSFATTVANLDSTLLYSWTGDDLEILKEEFIITIDSLTDNFTLFNSSDLLNYTIVTQNKWYIIFEHLSSQTGEIGQRSHYYYLYNFTVKRPETLSVSLVSPLNNSAVPVTQTFICNATTDSEYNLTNITFFMWNSTSNLINQTTESVTGTSNQTSIDITFTTDDTYIWNCEAFNTNGYSNWATDNFTVIANTDGPTITLDDPLNNTYFNNGTNIYFNFTATDPQGLDICELYGTFTGTWSLNYTWINPTNATQNFTQLNLSEGSYIWSVWCNDTTGNHNFETNNFTIVVDTTNPNLTINQPSGIKTSKTISYNISASDNQEMNTCIYWIMKNNSEEISNTTITCNSSMTGNFTVSSDLTEYFFHFFINDSTGNSNSSNSSFNVDTTTVAADGAGAVYKKVLDNFTLIYNKVWVTETIEIIRIEFFDKENNLTDPVDISVNYDNEYIEDKNLTQIDVGIYEKEFIVKNKTGKTNITFMADGLHKKIEIEIRQKVFLDKLKAFLIEGINSFKRFSMSFRDLIVENKYLVIVLGIIVLFSLMFIFIKMSIKRKTK